MNYKKLFYYFDSALSPFLCDKIIEEGYSNNPNIALTGSTGYTRSKKEIEQTKEIRNSNISWIGDVWLKILLEPYIQRANHMAGWNFDLVDSEDCQFTIYNQGQYYGWHTALKRANREKGNGIETVKPFMLYANKYCKS